MQSEVAINCGFEDGDSLKRERLLHYLQSAIHLQAVKAARLLFDLYTPADCAASERGSIHCGGFRTQSQCNVTSFTANSKRGPTPEDFEVVLSIITPDYTQALT